MYLMALPRSLPGCLACTSEAGRGAGGDTTRAVMTGKQLPVVMEHIPVRNPRTWYETMLTLNQLDSDTELEIGRDCSSMEAADCPISDGNRMMGRGWLKDCWRKVMRAQG